MSQGSSHAVVIGGSIAGLLAARVLTEHFAHVTILERDDLPAHTEGRRGVPQSHQPHTLLLRGKRILEQLYPGIAEDFRRHGALTGDMTGAGRIAVGRTYMTKYHSGLPLLFASRPLLERVVRDRTRALPGVSVVRGAAQGLLTTPDKRKVIGVHYRTGETDGQSLRADLVVDASGRGTRLPAWLSDLGYEKPQESRLPVNVGYTTRYYRREPTHLDGDLLFGVFLQQPKDRRAVTILALEDDRWHVALAGWHGEHAPADDAGFLEFARGYEHPDVHRFIRSLEPVSEFATHKYPANTRRHYERLKRFPEGLLVIGDALCSFNPTYGQGMTVAGLEALALERTLRRLRGRSLWKAYFKAAAAAVETPWSMATGGDGSYPESTWKRPLAARLLAGYFTRVQAAAMVDDEVRRSFFEVLHLVKPPTVFFSLPFVLRVLRASRSSMREGDRAA